MKALRHLRCLLLCLLLVGLVAQAWPAAASTYYVRTTGNDANDGSANDDAHAWKTLNKAFNTIVSGDVVKVAAGTYAETSGSGWLAVNNKVYNPAVTIQSASGLNDVILTAASGTSYNAYFGGDSSGFAWDHIEFKALAGSQYPVFFYQDSRTVNRVVSHTFTDCIFRADVLTAADASAFYHQNITTSPYTYSTTRTFVFTRCQFISQQTGTHAAVLLRGDTAKNVYNHVTLTDCMMFAHKEHCMVLGGGQVSVTRGTFIGGYNAAAPVTTGIVLEIGQDGPAGVHPYTWGTVDGAVVKDLSGIRHCVLLGYGCGGDWGSDNTHTLTFRNSTVQGGDLNVVLKGDHLNVTGNYVYGGNNDSILFKDCSYVSLTNNRVQGSSGYGCVNNWDTAAQTVDHCTITGNIFVALYPYAYRWASNADGGNNVIDANQYIVRVPSCPIGSVMQAHGAEAYQTSLAGLRAQWTAAGYPANDATSTLGTSVGQVPVLGSDLFTITLPAVTDVRSGVAYDRGDVSYTGTLALPAADDVRQGVGYGAGGTELVGLLGFTGPANGATLTIRRDARFSQTFTGLAGLTSYAKLYLTVKSAPSAQTDAQALLQLSTTGGLLRLNGAAPSDASLGTLEVLSATECRVTLDDAATARLPLQRGLWWDLSPVDGSGHKLAPLMEGRAQVTPTTTRTGN